MEVPVACHIVVSGTGDGCASALGVHWDSRAQHFLVRAQSLPEASDLPTPGSESKAEGEESALAALLAQFDDAICRLEVITESEAVSEDTRGAALLSMSLARLEAQRSDVLEQVLASTASLRWLTRLLAMWDARLRSLAAVAPAGSALFSVWLLQELLLLAATFQITGNTSEARRTSGLALRTARLLPPRAPSSGQTGATNRVAELQRAAERDLLTYVSFDTSICKSRELLRRRDPPPEVLQQLASDLGRLRLRAPLCVSILTAMASLMQRQQRHTMVTRVLAASPLTRLDEGLALLYARALERDGFWSHSVAVARRFLAGSRPEADRQSVRELLEAHAARLHSLQHLRDQAERLGQAQEHARAVTSFSKCMELLRAGPSSDKAASSLLLGRANSLLALGQASRATQDLEASVQLNPRNAVAQLVLKTTLLEQEACRIKARLGG